MPGPEQILTDLTRIANEAFGVAIVWHVVVAGCAAALIMGLRPAQRLSAVLLSVPLASVALLAWVFNSPFNALVFALAAVVLALLAARHSAASAATLGDTWSVLLGATLVLFAWVYPHFLVGHALLAYLYGSPMGVLPCPTLALVVGVALLAGGLVGGKWRLGLVLLSAFYGSFGVLRLGVWLDLVLLLGAVALATQHWQQTHERSTAAV